MKKIDQVLAMQEHTGWPTGDIPAPPAICSVSENGERDGYSVCYFPVKSWRILYPATEETGFHELQMQFSKAMAGA